MRRRRSARPTSTYLLGVGVGLGLGLGLGFGLGFPLLTCTRGARGTSARNIPTLTLTLALSLALTLTLTLTLTKALEQHNRSVEAALLAEDEEQDAGGGLLLAVYQRLPTSTTFCQPSSFLSTAFFSPSSCLLLPSCVFYQPSTTMYEKPSSCLSFIRG